MENKIILPMQNNDFMPYLPIFFENNYPDKKIGAMILRKINDANFELTINSQEELTDEIKNDVINYIDNFVMPQEDPSEIPDDKISELQNILNALLGVE